MFVFLAIIILMAQCLQDQLTGYRATMDHLYTWHVFTCPWVPTLHSNMNEVDGGHKKFDALQKIQTLSEILNRILSKFYICSTSRPSSNMVVFKQYIPNKHFNKRIHQLCYTTCDRKVYLRKDRQCIAQHLRANVSQWLKWKDVVKNRKWTISFPPWLTWWLDEGGDVGLPHQTRRVCPKPQDPRKWNWNRVILQK